jgi:hypothetical protein
MWVLSLFSSLFHAQATQRCINLGNEQPTGGCPNTKEIAFMKRITLVLGVVAVMVVMLVALAAPAMAKSDGGGHDGGHINVAPVNVPPVNVPPVNDPPVII